MGKPKTAEEALVEIYMHHTFPPLLGFPDFKEAMKKLATDLKEGREIDKQISDGLDQIIDNYFKTERGPLGHIVRYTDPAGNPYDRECECIESLLDGSYKGTGEENG